MSRNGTRRSSILRRRSGGTERLILIVKRFGLILAVCVGVFWIGAWFVLSGAAERTQFKIAEAIYAKSVQWGYSVKNILVDGRVETDAQTLRAMIDMEPGDPIFAFNPVAARENIEKLSWVKTAHVERRLPDTIYVRLEERVPMALWQRNKKLVLIDGEGAVLTDQNLARWKNLLIVVGEEAPLKTVGLLRMLAAEPMVAERVEAATLVSGRRWDLKLKSGAEVKLPEHELGLALRRLAVNHEEEAILDKDVLSIDVRDDARITVRTKPGAALALDRDLNATITPASGNQI